MCSREHQHITGFTGTPCPQPLQNLNLYLTDLFMPTHSWSFGSQSLATSMRKSFGIHSKSFFLPGCHHDCMVMSRCFISRGFLFRIRVSIHKRRSLHAFEQHLPTVHQSGTLHLDEHYYTFTPRESTPYSLRFTSVRRRRD